jgi:hypothetical protein
VEFNRSLSEGCRSLLRRIHELSARGEAGLVGGEITGLINQVVETREHVAALHLFQLCADRRIAPAASRGVARLLAAIPPIELAYLDQVMREMSPHWGVPSLKRGELHELNAEEQDLPFVLGLTSFHRDGYLREEALHALGARHDGVELPFMLVRLNDWVGQVRAAAREALEERLSLDYAIQWIVNLPLVLRLKVCGRGRHADLVRQVEQLVSSPEAKGALEFGCKAEDRNIRRVCFHLAGKNGLHELCERGLWDVDPVIRLGCARVLLRERSAAELPPLLDELLAARFTPIRREAVRTCVERCPELAEARLHDALWDDNIAIRELAAYYLKRAGMDIAAVYRKQLEVAEGPRLAISILGIGAHGQRQDASRVVEFFGGASPRIKRAVLRAVARLDREGHAGLITDALLSDLPGVSGEARDILTRPGFRADIGPLEVALTTSPLPHVRRNAFVALGRCGKYESLYYALLALGDQDELLRGEALRFISRWILYYNRSHARPTADQLARVKKALEEIRGELPGDVLSQLKFYTRPV